MARILFICAANICRSPSAQAVALERIAASGVTEHLILASAGTHVESRSAWCHEARTCVSVGPATGSVMAAHRSRSLSYSDVENADLLVAADRLASAEVIRIEPSVRRRLFTMREAAVLSQQVVEVARTRVLAGDARAPMSGAVYDEPEARKRLQWLVAEMDADRGTTSLLVERRRRRLFRTERTPVLDVDIPDAHVARNKVRHRKMLPRLASSVEQLMDDVVYVLGRPVP